MPSFTFFCLQNVNRDMPVSPINSSEQYYLVDIVSFILKYLKDKLYEAVAKSGLDMSQFQFDWVVTVPAIWDVRGKQMMREAAYKVRVSGKRCEVRNESTETKTIRKRRYEARKKLPIALTDSRLCVLKPCKGLLSPSDVRDRILGSWTQASSLARP